MVISLFPFVTIANFTFWWPLVAAQDNCFHPSNFNTQKPSWLRHKFDLPFTLFVADGRKKFVTSVFKSGFKKF